MSQDPRVLAPAQTLLSLLDPQPLPVGPETLCGPPGGETPPARGGLHVEPATRLACFLSPSLDCAVRDFFSPSLMFYSCKPSLHLSSEDEREDAGERQTEGLREIEGLGEKQTSGMSGSCCSKPDNLARSREDVLSWRLPDNKRSRHSDAIHCHLLVYHRFLFKPLHSPLGRAWARLILLHLLWGPGGSGRLCLC